MSLPPPPPPPPVPATSGPLTSEIEQVVESNNKKRARVSWKDINVEKTFMEACLQELGSNGREGGGLKALSWKKVAHVIYETHKFPVDRKQLSNHFNYLKGKYAAWLKLKNKTGNVYDASTNTFNLTDEEWELEMKANKYVESLRTTQRPYPELCAHLFNGVVATGVRSYGPSSTEPIPDVLIADPPLFEEGEKKGINDMANSTQADSSPHASSSRPDATKNKRKHKESMSAFEEKITGVLTLIAEKYVKPDPPTIDQCLAKLDELGWEMDDSLYDVALAIFSEDNQSYREFWMKLKPERCENWVRNIALIKGLML